jgi:hypothetical protein
MSELSELDLQRQRAALNQSLFREVNERIEDLAHDGVSHTTFVCECMSESCDAIVPVTVREYEQMRSDSNRFFVVPGHEVPSVEEIVDMTDRYFVVSKLGVGAAVAEHLDPRKR